jgi:hypothetical protein
MARIGPPLRRAISIGLLFVFLATSAEAAVPQGPKKLLEPAARWLKWLASRISVPGG